MSLPPPHHGPPPPGVPQPVILGPNPVNTVCPHCHNPVRTDVRIESTTRTHLFAVLLCFFGCCCIPYCMDSCKGKKHFCPHCSAYLGAYTD